PLGGRDLVLRHRRLRLGPGRLGAPATGLLLRGGIADMGARRESARRPLLHPRSVVPARERPAVPAARGVSPQMSAETWTVGRVLSWATADFRGKGFESARLEAELLVGR